MFSVNLDKLKVNEAELKAFIYQQLEAIHPYVGENAVSIRMSHDDNKFIVKIIAAHEIGDVEAEGIHDDVYKALAQAKDFIIKSLLAADVAEDEDAPIQRAQEIEDILAGKNYLH